MSDRLFEIHDDEINVDEIMARIQERARKRSANAPPIPAGPLTPPPMTFATGIPSGDDARDLDALQSSFNAETTLPSGTRLQSLKRFVQWAVRPITRVQTGFNAAAMSLLGRQSQQVSALTQAVAELQQMVAALDADVGNASGSHRSLEARVADFESRIGDLEHAVDRFCASMVGGNDAPEGRVVCLERAIGELRALQSQQGALQEQERALGHRHELLRQEVLSQKRRLELLLREMRQKAVIGGKAAATLREQEERLSDHYFVLQGDRFRGTDEEIRERLSAYVPLFVERQRQVGGDAYVLDIGCGRGELLTLLREAGIPARGVEQNEELAEVCREKGLEVSQGDGLTALAAVPDESLLGVTAIHVVEHLATNDLLEFVKLCHQKIRRGGALVMETPNPGNLQVGAAQFYLDLTHLRPIHPLALSYLAEALGFTDVTVRDLQSPPEELKLRLTSGVSADLEAENENWTRLNELLFGPMDYAVIATR